MQRQLGSGQIGFEGRSAGVGLKPIVTEAGKGVAVRKVPKLSDSRETTRLDRTRDEDSGPESYIDGGRKQGNKAGEKRAKLAVGDDRPGTWEGKHEMAQQFPTGLSQPATQFQWTASLRAAGIGVINPVSLQILWLSTSPPLNCHYLAP